MAHPPEGPEFGSPESRPGPRLEFGPGPQPAPGGAGDASASPRPSRALALEIDLARLEAGPLTLADCVGPWSFDPGRWSRTQPGDAARDESAPEARGDDAAVAADPLARAALRAAHWSGSALGLAVFVRALALGRDLPFVVAVPEGVERGLPTAARAVVLGRSPLTGGYAEGLVGSELGEHLAALAPGSADEGELHIGALALTGRTHFAGAVLVVGDTLELVACPELVGLAATRLHAALIERFGPAATLGVGPAGEAQIAFASLAAGGDPPHFVGRGLGAAFGATGLKAVVVSTRAARAHARARPSRREGALASDGERAALIAELGRSPRLAARARDGTFELYEAFAATDDLVDGAGNAIAPSAARALTQRVQGEAQGRHGCRGCPTPCGWTFELERPVAGPSDAREEAQPTLSSEPESRPGSGPDSLGSRVGGPFGARFGAIEAFALVLSGDSTRDGLELLATCDALGLDSKEAAARLALGCRAQDVGRLGGAHARGSVERLAGWLEDLVARRGEVALLAEPLDVAARALGLESEVTTVRGAWARPRRDVGAMLGVCVSMRGADPTRTFPFTSFGAGFAALAELVRPLELTEECADPRSPSGKGRLVWWHENLANAIDLAGFCAFSAAGLLADGLCDLDRLARWIAPRGLRSEPEFELEPGRTLLAAGARLARLQRALDERLVPDAGRAGAGRAGAGRDTPAWVLAATDEPGAVSVAQDEYRRLRGLDARGYLTTSSKERLAKSGSPGWVADEWQVVSGLRAETGSTSVAGATPERTDFGVVHLAAGGRLGELLGADLALELELPCRLDELLICAARRWPQARHLLWREEAISAENRQAQPERGRSGLAAAVFRSGRALGAADLVRAGDRLDLVFAIAGG